MAETADAADLNSAAAQAACGFETHLRHQTAGTVTAAIRSPAIAAVAAYDRRVALTPTALKSYVRAHYDARAPSWERHEAPYFGPPAEELVAQLRPGPHDRCLDLGCGSGLVARAFAVRVGAAQVSAVDLSPEQIEHARRVRAAAGLRDIHLAVRDAERVGFRPASFERVGSGFGISHFPRPLAALRGIFRVLAPGGLAGFTVWGPWGNRAIRQFDRRIARYVPALAQLPVTPEDEALDRVVERNSQPLYLAGLLRTAGFVRVRHRVHALVLDHHDAAGFVEAQLSDYAGDLDAAGVVGRARMDLRARLQADFADLAPEAFRVRRRYDTIVGSKPGPMTRRDARGMARP